MQAVADGDNGRSHGTRLADAFRQLTRPRTPGEQLTEADHEAAALVLAAHWPKFGALRPLPETWK